VTDALTAVLRRSPVGEPAWLAFWDRLRAGRLRRGEAAAMLASLSSRMPDQATTAALLAALAARRTGPRPRLPAANIVGTGGGPATFNISTAAALVAAAMGVPVVKTGSRAYTALYGSYDLLERLGIGMTTSHEQTVDLLGTLGVAFPGPYVYPPELGLLARSVLPLDMRVVGRFFNIVGPFLPTVSFRAQVTGVSDATLLPTLAHLAAADPGTRRWLCVNDEGADELVSVAENRIHPNDGSGVRRIVPATLGLAGGSMADLAPAPEGVDPVDHVAAVLCGAGPPAAGRTVCLNAAALAVAAGTMPDWSEAVAAATETLTAGAALAVVGRLRAAANRRSIAVGATVVHLGHADRRRAAGQPGRVTA